MKVLFCIIVVFAAWQFFLYLVLLRTPKEKEEEKRIDEANKRIVKMVKDNENEF